MQEALFAPRNFKEMATKTEDHYIRHPHTEEETRIIQANLSANAVEVDKLENEMKAMQQEFKDKMEPHKTAMRTAILSLRLGFEEVRTKVWGIPDHITGTMHFYDENGNHTSSRDLRPEERQLTISPML
jgi:hypothetical protein